MAAGQRFSQWWASYLRRSASPGAALALARMNTDIDITGILPTIHVPTLVVHRTDDRDADIKGARHMAARVPTATYVELPGQDHLAYVGDMDALLDVIEEFLTGTRMTHEPDRILATVLFVDIVGSTEHAVALGDQRWRDLLATYYTVVRREALRFRGREISSAGDGCLVTFDGPARAIQCACAISDAARRVGLEIRAGLHTGECEVMGNDVQGIAVHIAARVAAQARAGEVLVSRTVKDLVAGSGLRFADRDTHVLKGVPETWQLFAVEREGSTRPE